MARYNSNNNSELISVLKNQICSNTQSDRQYEPRSRPNYRCRNYNNSTYYRPNCRCNYNNSMYYRPNYRCRSYNNSTYYGPKFQLLDNNIDNRTDDTITSTNLIFDAILEQLKNLLRSPQRDRKSCVHSSRSNGSGSKMTRRQSSTSRKNCANDNLAKFTGHARVRS